MTRPNKYFKCIYNSAKIATALAVTLASWVTHASVQNPEASLVKVSEIALYEKCKVVYRLEPRGKLTYTSGDGPDLKTQTIRIYSDLCTHPTAQFINRLLVLRKSNGSSIVVGMIGSNEDIETDASVFYSKFSVPK